METKNHERELKELDKKITELSDALAKAAEDGGKHLREVLKRIHNPGWTTPAELAFAMAIMDGMQQQLHNLNTQIEGFTKSTEKVEVRQMTY